MAQLTQSIRIIMQRLLTGALVTTVLAISGMLVDCSPASAQTVSGVRSFDGGVAPLFNFHGTSHLYLDSQGTQGYLYTPGHNFESFSFRNPTTGQAWSGAITTFGPQLSIGLIQGAVQSGTPIVMPAPPRQTAPLPPISSTLLDDIP